MKKKQGETDKREMIFGERLKQTKGWSVRVWDRGGGESVVRLTEKRDKKSNGRERERRTFKKERKDRRVKMRGGKNGKSERSWRLGGVFLGVWL